MIIAINKPYGVLSQFNQNPDYPNQKTLSEFALPPGVEPLGRLDLDSEGLLILSDEAGLEDTLLSPKRGHKRCYLVQVDGTPDRAAIDLLRGGGLEIRGHSTKKCRVSLLDSAPELPERSPAVDPAAAKRSSWLKMELTEGKNRQVRRMTAKVGHPTLRLYRISIGCLQMLDLAPGQWAVLDDEQRQLLLS